MIIRNKLYNSFGPVGTTAGIVIFGAGIVATLNSWYGLILMALGAFVGFTSSGTIINTEERKVKQVSNYFGFIRTGKWLNIEPGMKIGIKRKGNTWRAYSRGNRELNISERDYHVILFDTDNRQIMSLMKTDSLSQAQRNLEDLSHRLGLNTV